MDKRLVVPANRVHVLLLLIELSPNHMLRMRPVALRVAPQPAWVPEEVHHPPVIGGHDELLVRRPCGPIDVGAVTSTGVDTVDPPTELAGLCGPLLVLEGGGTTGDLRAIHVPIQEVVASAD